MKMPLRCRAKEISKEVLQELATPRFSCRFHIKPENSGKKELIFSHDYGIIR